MGGAPKVMQWMRLKPGYVNGDFSNLGTDDGCLQPVKMLSSDLTPSANMCAKRRLATAPPAECPVMISEQELREGSSSSNDLRRAATGLIIFRATDRKPAWHIFPGSSYSQLASTSMPSRNGMKLFVPRILRARRAPTAD